jgi:hypoxanthine phosphoribosyltransferase
MSTEQVATSDTTSNITFKHEIALVRQELMRYSSTAVTITDKTMNTKAEQEDIIKITKNGENYVFKPFIRHKNIQHMAYEMAQRINEDYKETTGLHVLSIMDGAVFFSTTLSMHLKNVEQMQFMKVKSYQGTKSTGHVEVIRGLSHDVKGKDVLIVEDIVDTGLTMNVIVQILKDKGAKSVRIATMLLKIDPFLTNHAMHINYSHKDIRYIGNVIPNKWVVGFGLDLDGLLRNHPDILIRV